MKFQNGPAHSLLLLTAQTIGHRLDGSSASAQSGTKYSLEQTKTQSGKSGTIGELNQASDVCKVHYA